MIKNLHGTPTLKFAGCAIWRAGALWALVHPSGAFTVKRSMAEAMAAAAASRLG